MAVTEYKPINTLGCRYSYDKLENVLYLVPKSHVKHVYIDGSEAYIDGLSGNITRLEGFNIQFNEESSLDERYKFSKTVKFSLHGYVPNTSFNDNYYVIIKSVDGTKWMVNVDFPSKATYSFNLNGSQYQTDFTFSSLSNFPTLRLATNINEGVSPCKQLRTFGIEKLRLLETDYCRLNSASGTVYTYGKDFVDVDFLGQSCSLTEEFNGERKTTTISFNIAFDAYKSSWHYSLLEFLQNHYSSIIKPKGADTYFFSGFNFGLEPSFNISSTSQIGDSDIITVTLTETSYQGTVNKNTFNEQEETDTRWIYIKNVGIIKGYECIGVGVARYLLQQEINQNGIPTGRYKALEGYESNFPTLNIVGTFSGNHTFNNAECTEAICQVSTNIPTTITYRSATCNTYSYSASCAWNVSGLPSHITVSPSSGAADSAYTVTICNTKTPTSNETSTFNITAGNNTKVVNVNLTTDASILNPESIDINCLPQTVAFNFNANCPITVTNIDSRLSYQLRNSILSVYVPRNNSTTNIVTWNIGVKDCNNHTQTVTINQDKTYERWVTVDGYICSGTTSYTKQQRYTGTTSTNINTPTSEYRTGSVIQQNDSRCGSVQTRWTRNTSAYTCVDGDKWSIDEEEVSYDGTNWTKDGNTRLGEMVESASSFCEEEVEYEWRLTTNWQCYGTTDFNGKFMATYNDSRTYSAECDSNTTLTSATTKPSGYDYTGMTSAVIGDCITSIGARSFENCSGLTSVTIPYSVRNISSCAFARNENLSAITIPSSVRTIGSNAFEYCVNLRSVTIPSGVTTIEYGTFASCNSLSSVTIPSGLTRIASYAFYYCTSLPSVTIPNGVTFIGRQAFDSCTSLTSITIPSSVTEIAAQAFIGCNSLTSITVEATTPPALEDVYVFAVTNNCPIYVPCESLDSYKTAQYWSEYETRFRGISPCGNPDEILTFVALEDGTFKFSGNSVNYSLDSGSTWVALASDTSTPTVQSGHTIMWKANLELNEAIGVFSSTGEFNVQGNPMSLVYGDSFAGQTNLIGKNSIFSGLFKNCTNLVSAGDLILPATTLSQGCYESMFEGCTSLTTVPQNMLPATTLASNCYAYMFYGCESLTTAPQLPATTLTYSCYHSMFYGCESLTTAPQLLATTLGHYCYDYMFYGCTSLTTAPSVLPATTLTDMCYYYMFYGCSSLTTAPELPATTLASNCYGHMFEGCSSLTTAPSVLPATTLEYGCYSAMFSGCTNLTTAPSILPATTLTSDCYSYMFYGCASLTTAPELPATTLANYCYHSMFYGCASLATAPQLPATTLTDSCYTAMFRNCTSLTTAPVLSATTLANSCYGSMFYGCRSLTTAPVLSATTLANNCYGGMFHDCTSLTVAPQLPATTLVDYCYYGMFNGCTSLTTAPELPATTLANNCYGLMFYDCTSLTTVPVLSATTLAENCYQYMFSYCTSLNSITCLATDISATNCTYNWLRYVANSGTFTKASNMNSWSSGNSGIPNNWTIQNA